jgi:serine/threonine protein kinase, bacterial
MSEVNPEGEATEVEEPTGVVDGPTQAQRTQGAEHPRDGFAWSAEPDTDPERGGWSAVALKLLAPAVAVMLGAAAATAAFLFTGHRRNPSSRPPNTSNPSPVSPRAPAQPTSQPPPVVSAPPLDGTYRLDFDRSRRTHNGTPDPGPASNSALWMGFRSACTLTGCVATSALLDAKNLQAAAALDFYMVLHWVDGRWEGDHTSPTECSPVGDSSVSANQTEFETYSLEPQPDGTYSGTLTYTVQTNECGQQGSVRELPLTAVRTGPVPPGVVADPPTMSTLPQPPAHR